MLLREHVTKRISIFYGQEYVKIYKKPTKYAKVLACLTSLTSVV